jgi:hypothetical protein
MPEGALEEREREREASAYYAELFAVGLPLK